MTVGARRQRDPGGARQRCSSAIWRARTRTTSARSGSSCTSASRTGSGAPAPRRWRRPPSTSRSGTSTPRRRSCRCGSCSAERGEADIPIYNTHAGLAQLFRSSNSRTRRCKLLDQGYTALKMKVGRADSREDQRRVAAVRKAIGDGVLLMVDANQKWDLMQACHAARLLEEFDLAWLEEPLHPDDIRSHRVAQRGHLDSDRTRRARLHDACVSRLHRGRTPSTCPGRCLPHRRDHAVARSRRHGERVQHPRESARRRPDAGPSAHGQGDPEPLAARSDPDLGARPVQAPDQAQGREMPRRPPNPVRPRTSPREAMAEFRIS